MKNTISLWTLLLLALLCISCEKEITVDLNPENQEMLEGFLHQIQTMEESENAELRTVLREFYVSANSRACDPANFDFVTEQNLTDYSISVGFQSTREMHDWVVDFGMLLRDVISDPYVLKEDMIPVFMDMYPQLLHNAGLGSYAEPRSLGNDKCSVEALSEFSYYAVLKANNYGTRSSKGIRVAGRNQLIGWGSSLHRTFVLLESVLSCT